MPVLYNGDDYRHHSTEDYSFVTRSDWSRDFARRRRFGDEDELYDRPMSQTSLPLRIGQVGSSSRRGYSPYEDCSPPRREERYRSTSPGTGRRSRLSGAVRQALAVCGELDEDDPYYKARLEISSPPPHYDEIDEDDDDDYVIVMKRRRKRPQSKIPHRKPEYFLDDASDIKNTDDHEWRKGLHRQQKLDHEQNTDLGYTIPISRRSFGKDQDQEEESDYRRITSYLAKRKQFAVEDDDVIQKMKNKKYEYKTKGPNRLFSDLDVEDESRRGIFAQAPMFVMKPRSHTVWEKMYVKFTCTIRGTPQPKVTWYHNMISIDPTTLMPGTMRISSQFGVHTLEIFQASLEDSGTYRVSAQNHKGEISSYATLIVRRYDGSKLGYYDVKSGYNLKKPTDFPDVETLDVPGYPQFITRLFNKKVVEGEAVSMSCHVDGDPTPEVFWTLNGRNLDDKINHMQLSFDGEIASLIIMHSFCDDEGEYICRAYNSCGSSTTRCFLTVTGINAPPSAPTGLICKEINRNYLTISWNPPGYSGHFGGAPVQGYLVEKALAESSVWKQANKKAIQLTTTPLTNLEEGQVYFLRVRGFNRWGRGPASLPLGPIGLRDGGSPRHPLELKEPGTILPPQTDEIEYDVSTEAPSLPFDVKAKSNGTSIVISWKASQAVDDNCGIIIEYQEKNDEDWKVATGSALKTNDPYPVTGLEEGKLYKFRVRAVNGAGISEASSETDFIVFDGERVQPMEFISGHDEESTANILQESVFTMQQVMVENEGKKEERYRGPPSPPRDVQCLKAKREYIEVGWLPPAQSGGDQVRYFVEYRKLGCESWNTAHLFPIRYTQFPVGELDQGESYMFRVRCVNKYGTSSFSEPSELILASDGINPPNWWGGMQGLFKVAEDNGKRCVTKESIKVCWDAPTTDGGSKVTGYYLEYRPCGGKFRPVNNKPINQRHFTVDGLNPGEFYEFRVKACNEVGCGDWKIMPGRVQAKDPEKPGEPTNVLITDVGEEEVRLEWKKPENLGDGELLGYIVERRKEEVDFWIPCNKLPEQIQNEEYTVSGLIKDQTYFFRVRAVNQIGEGANSFQSCYVTMGEPFADLNDRQNALYDLMRKKKEKELERIKLQEKEERKEAFLTKIEDCYTCMGGQARFECKVKNKRTKVKWFLGNWKELAVEPKGKYDIISSGRKRALIINNCNEADVQAVHCVAQYNKCQCVADLIVDKMVPVRFIRCPKDIYITKGERAIFDCVLSKPTAKVSWMKFDSILFPDADTRYEFITQGCGRSFLINDTDPDDIAMYTISGLGGSYTVNLVIDGVLPVKFEKEISSENLPYTANVALFDCLAVPSPLYGNETPPCKWYHNGELVEPYDDKYELISDGNKHILKILNPTYEDNGTILCVVGGGKTCCDIYVEKPPPPPPKPVKTEDYIINFEQGLKAEALASSIRLYCVVSNLHENANIIWYRNDEVVTADSKTYKMFNNTETGLVTLVISPITDELAQSKFTCEFITPHSTFDTKVNFELDNDEFKKISKEAQTLLEQEEKDRKARKEEREKKKQERKRKEKETESSGACDATTRLSVPDGMVYDVSKEGSLIISAKANVSLEKCKICWLKDSEPVIDKKRFFSSVEDNMATLEIKNPCSEDAGTFTCQIKSGEAHCETSVDFTGKVFKKHLLKSAEIRINPLADCENIIIKMEKCNDNKKTTETAQDSDNTTPKKPDVCIEDNVVLKVIQPETSKKEKKTSDCDDEQSKAKEKKQEPLEQVDQLQKETWRCELEKEDKNDECIVPGQDITVAEYLKNCQCTSTKPKKK